MNRKKFIQRLLTGIAIAPILPAIAGNLNTKTNHKTPKGGNYLITLSTGGYELYIMDGCKIEITEVRYLWAGEYLSGLSSCSIEISKYRQSDKLTMDEILKIDKFRDRFVFRISKGSELVFETQGYITSMDSGGFMKLESYGNTVIGDKSLMPNVVVCNETSNRHTRTITITN